MAEKGKATLKPEIVKKTKVCIVGCATSKDLAPYDDPDMEFWGVNNLFLTMPKVKWSRWFEIHELTFDGRNWVRRGSNDFRGQKVGEYIQGLSQLKCPIYMQRLWPQIPNSILYPLQPIVERFGRYFTNTVSWEIALGIHEGFKEIHIYGVDMAVGSEYNHQRPSCEYFIGMATGLGIKVVIPDQADLLKTRFLYAFEEQKSSAWTKKTEETLRHVRTQRQQAEANMLAQRDKMQQAIGAEHAIAEMGKVWG